MGIAAFTGDDSTDAGLVGAGFASGDVEGLDTAAAAAWGATVDGTPAVGTTGFTGGVNIDPGLAGAALVTGATAVTPAAVAVVGSDGALTATYVVAAEVGTAGVGLAIGIDVEGTRATVE